MRISDWSSDVCSSDLDVDRTIRFGFCETHPAPFPSSRPQPASGVPFRLASVLALAVEADAEEFEAMVDEAIAQGAGDFSLQPLALPVGELHTSPRSDERRGGEEGVRTCRHRWLPSHKKKKDLEKKYT